VFKFIWFLFETFGVSGTKKSDQRFLGLNPKSVTVEEATGNLGKGRIDLESSSMVII
jgi:hypothetical protein